MDALQRFEWHRRSGRGEHYWTKWGPFNPVLPSVVQRVAAADELPTDTPILAYRTRACPCGALEQESYQGERRLLARGEDR